MSTDALEQYEREKLAKFTPITVRKRKGALASIIQEIEKRHFKNLDEKDKDDLKKIQSIVFELNPELTERTQREYAKACIGIWKIKKSKN